MSVGERALIVSFSPIASDPRVMRQVRVLAPRFTLTVAGFGQGPDGVESFVALDPPKRGLTTERFARLARLFSRRFDAYYWNLRYVALARRALSGQRFDLIVANDVHALPLALDLADGAAVLLDAHEFSPREFEDRPAWRAFYAPYAEWLCRTFLPRVHAMTTVAPGIAEAYRSTYDIEAAIVFSAPAYAALEPSPVVPDRFRIVHHGAAAPSRKLEAMIEVLDLLDERFTLDLMLVPGDPRYLARLVARAKRNPRIRVLPPVRMEEIVPFTNQYDVGMFLLPPTNFNYAHALPNKFFEFVQARLAVAIGPSPEMQGLIERYGCGIVAHDFTPPALARALSGLTADGLRELKANAHRAAQELCFERSAPTFLAAVERALRRR
jgi:hypothetical protein